MKPKPITDSVRKGKASAMTKWLVNLSRSHKLRTAFRSVRGHRVYNAFLSRWPRYRNTPKGLVYRSKKTESVSAALEILEGGYIRPMERLPKFEGVVAFCDLGCNVGYFAVALADHYGPARVIGSMVDANCAVLGEAEWHIKTNRLNAVTMLGIVGTKDNKFYINRESNTVCHSVGLRADHPDWFKRQFRTETVEPIPMSEVWPYGNQRCNVLKLDIEGAEADFFKNEAKFMEQVDCVLVEWHVPYMSKETLFQTLHGMGFVKRNWIEESPAGGMAIFYRMHVI